MEYLRSNFIVLIVLLLSFNSKAQNIGSFKQYNEKDGFNSSVVHSVYQDKKGFIWIATQNGLYKYDGYNFRVFKKNETEYSLVNNWVIKILLEDENSGLWILTGDAHLSRLDLKTEKFEKILQVDERFIQEDDLIAEDSLGLVWISTKNNLFNYCINSKVINKCLLNDSSSVKSSRFLYSNKQYSWFSSVNGIIKYVKDSEKIVTELNAHEDTAFNFLYYDQKIYFTSTNNLYKYNPDNKDLKTIHKFDNRIFSGVVKDSMGNLWFKNEIGVIRLNLFKGHYKLFKFQENGNFPILIKDNKENVWVAENNKISLYDFKQESFREFYFNDVFSNEAFVDVIDNGQTKWISITKPDLLINDIYNISLKNGEKMHQVPIGDKPSELDVGQIENWFLDNNNNIWLTGYYLRVISPRQNEFYHYSYKPTTLETEKGTPIYCFTEVDSLICVAPAFGLVLFDPLSKEFKKPSFFSAFDDMKITALDITDQGILYASAYNKGLLRINLKEKKFRLFKHDPENSTSISSNLIPSLMVDHNNKLWISTMGKGVDIYDPGDDDFTHFNYDTVNHRTLFPSTVFSITQDDDSIYWFGMNGVVYKYNSNYKQLVQYDFKGNDIYGSVDRFFSINAGANDDIWLGNFGNGLFKLNDRNDSIEHWTEKDGLINNQIYGIIESEPGELWISTNSGLSKFDYNGKIFRNYNTVEGLVNSEFNHNAYFKSSNGTIYFGGTRGFTMFKPEEIIVDSSYLSPVITKLYLFGEEVLVNDSLEMLNERNIVLNKSNYYTKNNISFVEELELLYNQNYLTIEFSNLVYGGVGSEKYKYMLKGLDENWIYSDSRNYATYNKLTPGNYEFLVTSANNEGVWNQNPTKIMITVLPPFWLTKWFFLMVVLVIIALIATYIKYRERNLRLQKQKLKSKVQERTNEITKKNIELEKQNELIKKQKTEIAFQARQIKNELIAQNKESELALLRSQINPHFLFNTLNNINTLVFIDQQKTYDAILKLSEIMRYMHNEQTPDFVTIEKEVEYIKSFVELQRLRFKNENFVELNTKVENPNVLIAPMIFIAFVENAFKHCNKKDIIPAIKIDIISEHDYIKLNVMNYYSKKEKGNKSEGGFGLKNIKERLELIYRNDYKLEISDKMDIFEIELQLKRKNGKNRT